MQLSLIPFLVAAAGVIAVPVSKLNLDSQTAVEEKLEIRTPQVSLWFHGVSSCPKTKKTVIADLSPFCHIECKSCSSLSYAVVDKIANG